MLLALLNKAARQVKRQTFLVVSFHGNPLFACTLLLLLLGNGCPGWPEIFLLMASKNSLDELGWYEIA